ncbi:ImmA/IrrE family metallo-endopeptidase [Sharpea azabuensis]|uniref:ImmA/IrrE family metallo-endopeptidase n=1 Tax=Sharpea azabuensis TaxID=322505 RepID=UPI0009E0093D|nr:ImmA/IrrE family metallo-endopeptidase [Sharpea azabuensis]
MGYYTQDEIVAIVNKLIKKCGTRDPYRVADELGINILYRDFKKQRGAYKVILKNRFIFLQNGLHPVIEQIVLWHEIGHDMLHRQEAALTGEFQEFNIFDMRENRILNCKMKLELRNWDKGACPFIPIRAAAGPLFSIFV